MGLGIKTRVRRVAAAMKRWAINEFGRPSLYDLSTPERVGAVYRYPSDMCEADRLLLYALVRGLRPRRAVEIGVRWGNSARIITSAMEDAGRGQLVGIDPETRNFRAPRRDLHGRYTLVEGYSPEAIPDAAGVLGGPIDFALVDGLHTHDAVLADVRGLVPHLADGAHVLLHDAYHQGIFAAGDAVLSEVDAMSDCGVLSRSPSAKLPVSYQGLRMLRFGAVDHERLLHEAHDEAGLPAPKLDPELWNYDVYLERQKARAAAPAREHEEAPV